MCSPQSRRLPSEGQASLLFSRHEAEISGHQETWKETTQRWSLQTLLPTFRYFHFGHSPLLLTFFLFFFFLQRTEQIFKAELNKKLACVFGHKGALYRNSKTIRLICFTALHGISFMGKVHINFGVTYTKIINDYPSWFIIATLLSGNRGQDY